MSSNGHPAPPTAPEEAKRSRRGGKGSSHTCRNCHLPKKGHPKGTCSFVERDDDGQPIVNKIKAPKPDPVKKAGLPYHKLNEAGIERLRSLESVADDSH